MKDKRYSYTLMLLFLAIIFANNVNAQGVIAGQRQPAGNNPSIGLGIGDQLPDFIIPKVINLGPKKKMHTSDFHDQLLIIDFWATTCHGCVAALPKMKDLEKAVGGKLAILPVTFENEKYVTEFWRSNSHLKNLSLPSVVEDTIFEHLFKHRAEPHEVWIYKGKVVGITGPEYVDLPTIQKVLAGEHMNWPVKNDFYVFNPNIPIFQTDSAQIDSRSTSLDYTAACGYKEGVNSIGSGSWGVLRDSLNNTVRTYFVNASIYTAFEVCFNYEFLRNPEFSRNIYKPTQFIITPNQVKWEVANRDLYQYQDVARSVYHEQEWLRFHGICFESVHPNALQNDTQVYARAIKDLNLIFGLNVRWEKRLEEVYVLKKAPAGTPRQVLKDGFSASNLVASLNEEETNPYVFNETSGEMYLPLAVSKLHKIEEITAKVKPYGLVLQKENRMVDKLIFAEANASLLPDMDLVNEYNKRKANEKSLKPIGPTDNKDFFVRNKTNRDVITLPSGLQYKIIKQGTGARPLATDNVRVNYTGMLVNGKIFSSSLSTGVPTNWHLSNDIPPGIKEALQLMPVGSKYEVYIPADLGFRDQYFAAMIPKDSGLIYEIELVGIIK